MRTTIALLLAGLCALAIARAPCKPHCKVGDRVTLKKQQDILRLFNYINQPSYYKDFIEIADNFKWEGMWNQWTKPEVAKHFWYMYQKKFLVQGEIFSIFYPKHLEQVIALFKTFYYAKDYDTFFKTAVWARQNVNEAMFVYALSVAIVHSDNANGVILPAIYEICPHYFFNNEVIVKTQQHQQQYRDIYEHGMHYRDWFEGYTIQANYSGWYMNFNSEQSMTYFTEDVGVNAYYYYYGIFAPWWLPNEIIDYNFTTRGEYFYWFHQQLLARYYLERLSNNMGEIPHYSYEHPIETGYSPSLHYPNGLRFASRPNHANLYYHGVQSQQSYSRYGNYIHTYTYVKDYERRLRDTVDMRYFWTSEGKMGYLFDKEGMETLGNLVESNDKFKNSSQFYGDLLTFSRHLLGYAYHPNTAYNLAPSALEHFETSVRDPMFWQMFKRMMYYFHQYQEYTGPYKHKELVFENVKIKNVTISRLVTYFDYYYSDLSNAAVMNKTEYNKDRFLIRAQQYRLNHQPFNYKINVVSDKYVKAFVKVFIGPKYDEYGREIDMDLNRHNFFEIDRFQYTIQPGMNVIQRNSNDSLYFSEDRTTFFEFYHEVMNAVNDGEEFYFYPYNKYYGFPQRMLLPKGDFEGKTYQFLFTISPYHQSTKAEHMSNGIHYMVDHHYSIGYPMDRPIKYENEFNVQNFYFKDVVIFHKKKAINTTRSH